MKPFRQNTPIDTSLHINELDSVQQFAEDVRAGLGKTPKSLPCIYFYDETGSKIFEQICRQPEYYCTRAEGEILQTHACDIAAHCCDPVQIVELGSGSSAKTRILLEAFVEAKIQTTYVPIDVSPEILSEGADRLRKVFPFLVIKPIAARYEDGLEKLDSRNEPVLLLWLGSSIGNYERTSAKRFLGRLRRQLTAGDSLLLGVDLIKDVSELEAAYNDRAGVTAAFNLNVLERINRELGGTFNPEQFEHDAVFNTAEGRIEMYLISRCRQQVQIEALDMTIQFSRGERIHTENSYKYHPEEIAGLGEAISANLVHQWFDARKRFSLNLFDIKNGGSL
jgi:L-histidine N-alpha-methyltransferase